MLESVLKHYDLGEIYDFTSIPQTFNYLITASEGKYVLRSLSFLSKTKNLQYDYAFTEYLRSHNYPARRIIKTVNNTLVCKENNTAYFITEYFDGAFQPNSQRKLSEDQLIQSGAYLAKLHRLSENYTGLKARILPFQSTKVYKILQNISTIVTNKTNKTDFDLLVSEVIRKKVNYIAKFPFELQDFMSSRNMMNHGDFHAGNIVFDLNNNVIGILDFEYCRDMPRIWDIGWGLTWLCKMKSTEAFSGPSNVNHMKIFLSSYHDYYPLSKEEQESLLRLCVSSCFHSTYFLEHYYLKNRIPKGLEKCNNIEEWFWWANNQDRIKDAIKDSCKLIW